MLTPLEAEALEVFQLVRDRYAARHIRRYEYLDLMGSVRDMIVKLENKRYGCPTGKHKTQCQCKGA